MKERTKNTLLRIMSAAIALPIYVYAIITSQLMNLPILLVSLIISLMSLYEFYRITERPDAKPFIAGGMVAATLVNIALYLYAFGGVYGYSRYINAVDARLVMGIVTFFVAAVLIYRLRENRIPGSAYAIGTTVFGVVFIALFTSHLIMMKALRDGYWYILILNIVVMLNDSGAYFGGVYAGKHKLKLGVSPNKTWEGYFSGLIVSVIAMVITSEVFAVYFGIVLFSRVEAALLGVALSTLGNAGDLVESLFKRDGGIKDSGSLIPGHGGMWDVFDALIFTYPLFYYYLILKGVR